MRIQHRVRSQLILVSMRYGVVGVASLLRRRRGSKAAGRNADGVESLRRGAGKARRFRRRLRGARGLADEANDRGIEESAPESRTPEPSTGGPGPAADTPDMSEGGVRKAIPGRPDRSGRTIILPLQLAVVVIVFGQRLAVPVGSAQVPFVLVGVYGVLVVLAARDLLRYDRVRFELFVVGMAACCLATLLASIRGEAYSVASLLYLLMSYLPWVFCVRSGLGWIYPLVVRFYLNAMVVVALLAVTQMGLQFLNVRYPDPVSALPEALRLGSFNTTYPVVYGSSILKSNGMVMLEPSFLSQFLALAAVGAVLIRASAWRVALYGVALVASVSGTGVVLLVVGFAALIGRARGWMRPALFWPAVALVAVMLTTPLGAAFSERRGEFGSGPSSANLRFITPYEEVASGLEEDPARYLTGAGAGAADRTLESGRDRHGMAVVYPSLAKLVYEYGIVSGLLFAAFMVVCLFWRVRLPVLPTCCFLMLFVLSGSLLQPHTVFLVWILTSLFGRSDAEAAAGLGDPHAALTWMTHRRRSEASLDPS